MDSNLIFVVLGVVVIVGLALRGISPRARIRRWLWERAHSDEWRV